jgi:hypothetical protein
MRKDSMDWNQRSSKGLALVGKVWSQGSAEEANKLEEPDEPDGACTDTGRTDDGRMDRMG